MTERPKKPKSTKASAPENPFRNGSVEQYLIEQGIDPQCVAEQEAAGKIPKVKPLPKETPGKAYDANLSEICPLKPVEKSSAPKQGR